MYRTLTPKQPPPPPQVPASTPSTQPRYQIPQRQGSLEPAVPPCKGVGSWPRMPPGGAVPLSCPGRTWLNPVDGWKGHCGTNIFMCVCVCVCVCVHTCVRVPVHGICDLAPPRVPAAWMLSRLPAVSMSLIQLPKQGVWPCPASRGTTGLSPLLRAGLGAT